MLKQFQKWISEAYTRRLVVMLTNKQGDVTARAKNENVLECYVSFCLCETNDKYISAYK